MPNRPSPHVISDQAVAAVRAIWAQQGAAVEEIRRDYGEDLLVQTQLRGRMDGSRIWVQVKGTTHDLSDDSKPLPPIPVKSTLALRWTRTSDLIIVILWDVSSNIGWYAKPQSLLNETKFIENQKRITPIQVSRMDKFDPHAAKRLAWHARIRHAEAQLLRAKQSATAYGLLDASAEESSIRERVGILYRVMEDLQIMSLDHRLTPEFRRILAEECGSRVAENEDLSADISRAMAGEGNASSELADAMLGWTMVALVQAFEDETGHGAPVSLVADLAVLVRGVVFGDLLTPTNPDQR